MDTLIGTAQKGVEQLQTIVMWMSGLSGGASLIAVWLMIQAGSAVIRMLARILLIFAILACAVWAYLYFGLDAYFNILPSLGLG